MALFLSEYPIWKGCPNTAGVCKIVLVDCQMDSYIVTNSSFVTYGTNYTTGMLNYTIRGINNYYPVCPISHIDIVSDNIDQFYFCRFYREVGPKQVMLDYTEPSCLTFGVNTDKPFNFTFYVKIRSYNFLQTSEKQVFNATL